MAKPSLSEQLDHALEQLRRRLGRAGGPLATAELAQMVRVAELLQLLPRRHFRAALRERLEQEVKMQESEVKTTREGFSTITPYVAVREALEVIEFVKRAFEAEGGVLGTGSAGGIHAELKIGDAVVMIGGGATWRGEPMPTSLHYYVPDVDMVYRRALEAGATSLRAPTEQGYGDRDAAVRDAGGNHWYIATHRGPSYIPEGYRAVTPFLHPHRGLDLVAFLEKAFGAERLAIHQDIAGTVVHGAIRIGNAILEIGEAHGQWQPMPTMFFLHVDDADAWYRRAIATGAESVAPPADQPYGERTAAVKDAWGNLWYTASPPRDATR